MATAAMIAVAETRQADAKTRARQQWQAYVDRWVDGREATSPAAPPSLEALTPAVFARRQEWTGTVAEALVAQPHGRRRHPRPRACPQG